MDMNCQRHSVVVFHTIHAMFRLKKELDRLGVEVRIVPVPRSISSDCGSALLIGASQEDAVRSAASDGQLEIQGIYEFEYESDR